MKKLVIIVSACVLAMAVGISAVMVWRSWGVGVREDPMVFPASYRPSELSHIKIAEYFKIFSINPADGSTAAIPPDLSNVDGLAMVEVIDVWEEAPGIFCGNTTSEEIESMTRQFSKVKVTYSSWGEIEKTVIIKQKRTYTGTEIIRGREQWVDKKTRLLEKGKRYVLPLMHESEYYTWSGNREDYNGHKLYDILNDNFYLFRVDDEDKMYTENPELEFICGLDWRKFADRMNEIRESDGASKFRTAFGGCVYWSTLAVIEVLEDHEQVIVEGSAYDKIRVKTLEILEDEPLPEEFELKYRYDEEYPFPEGRLKKGKKYIAFISSYDDPDFAFESGNYAAVNEDGFVENLTRLILNEQGGADFSGVWGAFYPVTNPTDPLLDSDKTVDYFKALAYRYNNP